MKPFRSMVTAALMMAALGLLASSARAQGFYGPNVDPYAAFNPAYGGYGYDGFATAPVYNASDVVESLNGFGDQGAAMRDQSQPRPRRRARSSSRRAASPNQAQAADGRQATGVDMPYTPYKPTRPATVDPRLKALVSQSGGSSASYLDPWLPTLRADQAQLGRGMPQLEGQDPRLSAEMNQLDAGMSQLAGDVPYLDAQMNQLGAGMPQLGDGMPYLNPGVSQLGAGMPQLGAGVPYLGAGTPQLGVGVPQMSGAAMPRLNASIPPLGTGLPIFGAGLSKPMGRAGPK